MMLNKRLIDLIGKNKLYIIGIIVLKWGALLLNVLLLYIFANIFDILIQNKSDDLFRLFFSFVMVLIFRFLFNYYAVLLSGKAASQAKTTLRKKLYQKIIILHGQSDNSIKTMGVLQAANEGIESLENYFGRYLPQLFYAIIAPITLFIVLTFISFKVALVFILCVPLIPLAIVGFMQLAKRIMKDYWGGFVDLSGAFLENLRGLNTLKLFQVEDRAHQEMDQEAENFRKITMKLLSMQLNSVTIMDLVAYCGSAAGIITALLQLKINMISFGEFIFILLIASEFFIPLRLLGSYFHVAMTSVTAADHIFEILDMPEPVFGDKKIEKIYEISFDGLSFEYEKDQKVLSDITFKIIQGEYIAIVGDSGSGKSTIASLMMGLIKPKSGKLSINQAPINSYEFDEIMGKLTLISTNSPVFNSTIKENLLIAKHDATDEEILTALENTQLIDEIKKFPDGVDTYIGEQGNQLSGGQKQRLAIARALLSDREVLIFDEATSNIDSISEELIWDLIHQLKGKKTLITISHRLFNVRNADRIYLLDQGQIREQGNHAALMNQGGIYATLVNKQMELENYRGVI